jgi:LmbE family N-acetylglucosaminyl deacetylase
MKPTLNGNPPRVLVVVAHPDDETVGAGCMLARLPGAFVLHLTDGAPRSARFRAPGFSGSRADYASARRRELETAMRLAGIGPERLHNLGVPDQEAILSVSEIASRIVGYSRRIKAEILLTHAYEGGHPDHDAAALACRAAFEQLRSEGGPVPELMEMALYHANEDGEMVIGEFLPAPTGADCPVARWELTGDEKELKRRMIEAFASQRETLAPFLPPPPESFRPAPLYDFSQPPHSGALQYELWGFPLDGEGWREAAQEVVSDVVGAGLVVGVGPH